LGCPRRDSFVLAIANKIVHLFYSLTTGYS
jgi:hypothetical protein